MALNFQFDPSIYQRHAAQRAASDQSLMNALAGAAQMYQQGALRRQATLDAARQKELERNEAARLEALKPENILAKSIQFGEESLTPEERSAFNAYEQMEAAQRKSDMLGNIYQPYQPIGLGESRLATALQAAPTTDYDTMLQPPSEEDYAPTPIGEKKEKVADLLEGVPSRVAGSPKVQADVAKEVAASRIREKEEERKNLFDKRKSYERFKVQGDSMIDTIDSLLEDPGLGQVSGGIAGLQGRQSQLFPVTRAQRRIQSKLDQLKGKVFLDAYERLKGGGVITEIEGKKAEQALAALDQSQSDEDYKKALQNLRDVVSSGLARQQEELGMEVTYGTKSKGSSLKDLSTEELQRMLEEME